MRPQEVSKFTLTSLKYNYFDRYDKCNTLFITVAPSLTSKPKSMTIIEGDTATFYCNATGNPTPKITWSKDGKTVAKGETLSLEANRSQSGEYWCTAENGLNSTVNASANLDVQCMYNLELCNSPFTVMYKP